AAGGRWRCARPVRLIRLRTNKSGDTGQGERWSRTRMTAKPGATPGSLAAERLIAMTHADIDWRARAACLSADPDLFFPLSSAGPSLEQLRLAKSVCARCPVRAPCLDFAIGTDQTHGVWGGTSEDERHRIMAWGPVRRHHSRTEMPVGASRGH